MRYLILINKKFPFQVGESFLENEINEIPQSFDRVLLFPIYAGQHEQPTRRITKKEVQVLPINAQTFQQRKWTYGLRAVIKTIAEKSRELSLSQQFDQHVDNTIAEELSKKIIRKLDKITFLPEDEVVIYSYWLHTTATIAVKLKNYFTQRRVKVLTVSRAHGFDIYEERKKNGYLPSREFLMSNLDSIFPISENGADYLKKRFPHHGDKITVAKLGTYDQGKNAGSKEDSFHILTVSRMIPLKRLNLLVDALSTWEDSSVHWTHIGDGPEKETIIKLAKTKLKNTNFKFLGYKSNQEVYQFYKQNPVDAFVNISSSEGIPVSIMEAISFGIPVVATDVGGTSEIVSDKQTGFLIPAAFSKDILIHSLKKLKNQSALEKETFRDAIKEFWCQRYQAKMNYDSFYKKIMKELTNE